MRTTDSAKSATMIGAALFGVPGAQRAVEWELSKDRLRLQVRALGGSDADAEAAVNRAVERWQATLAWGYTIGDACSDILYEYTLRL